jgi:AmmeMemoRadiSam system protein B
MLDRRPSAVAGTFYPDDPDELARTVDDFLAHVTVEPAERVPKALVVPHAGYIYSGPIAASAFARLRPARDRIERVVLVGPAHRAPVSGLVSPGARTLETPLGDLDVDLSALALVPQVGVSVFAHSAEHSLEVELPFLQRVLPRARLVPLAAGHADAESVGRVLEALWGGPETAIVISSDLSHYLPYARAQATDSETIARILALDIDGVESERACGATGLRGLLWVARRKHLSARAFDVRNSGDTAGDRKRVVGYAAIGFYET